jgi:hypothetical protein
LTRLTSLTSRLARLERGVPAPWPSARTITIAEVATLSARDRVGAYRQMIRGEQMLVPRLPKLDLSGLPPSRAYRRITRRAERHLHRPRAAARATIQET